MPNEYNEYGPMDENNGMELEPHTPRSANIHGKLDDELSFGDANDTTAAVLRGVAEYDQEGYDDNIMKGERTQEDLEVQELMADMNNEFSDARMDALKADLDRSWNPPAQTQEHGRETPGRTRGYEYSTPSRRLGLRPINRGRGRLR